ncbi:MAG: hypothetical protein J4A00_11010, partial [Gammaproteobacteria bacterium]|nr:hypothetical protein [Gammaproteobacteria bacterium]
FATVTAIIEQQGCTIVDARINTTRDGFVLDTFQLLGGDGDTPLGRELQSELRKKIEAALDREKLSPVKSKMRVTRRQKLFTSVPEVNFYNTPGVNRTVMELRMTDRPGLLSRVASILRQQDVRLHDARINTYGERVEDTFFISTPDGQAIDQGPALDALGAAIADGLQETV